MDPARLCRLDIDGKQAVALPCGGGSAAEQQLAGPRDVSPPPPAAVGGRRQRIVCLRLAGGRIEPQAFIADGHKQAVPAKRQIAAVMRRLCADGPGYLPLPELHTVVGVVGHDGVFTLNEQAPVDRQRPGGPGVAVDHVAGSGAAEPEHSERGLDADVVAAGRVARLGVLVCPASGAGKGAPRHLQPRSVRVDRHVGV